MQSADGSFALDDRLAHALGAANAATLRAACASVTAAAGGTLDDRAIATALVLAVLEARFAASRDSWALFAKRSSSWLRKALSGDAARLAAVTSAAAAVVTGL
jgi:hypothetical protein